MPSHSRITRKSRQTRADRHSGGSASAAFLVSDDIAIGPLLRYNLRQSGIGTNYTRDYHTATLGVMADVYGNRIRMRWIAGFARVHERLWSAASDRFPAHIWTNDNTVTPRYPLLVYDDHPYEGVFWSGGIGVRM